MNKDITQSIADMQAIAGSAPEGAPTAAANLVVALASSLTEVIDPNAPQGLRLYRDLASIAHMASHLAQTYPCEGVEEKLGGAGTTDGSGNPTGEGGTDADEGGEEGGDADDTGEQGSEGGAGETEGGNAEEGAEGGTQQE